MDNVKQEAVKQAFFSIPAAWMATITMLLGFSLNEWVGISSIIYCALQSVYLIYRWVKELRNKVGESE
jgi:MFS superfamily sulfate permease-like transporter